jgi:hypothetical protein
LKKIGVAKKSTKEKSRNPVFHLSEKTLQTSDHHNILQARASRPFSTMQNNIQQHPRSTAMLDSHDLQEITLWDHS